MRLTKFLSFVGVGLFCYATSAYLMAQCVQQPCVLVEAEFRKYDGILRCFHYDGVPCGLTNIKTDRNDGNGIARNKSVTTHIYHKNDCNEACWTENGPILNQEATFSDIYSDRLGNSTFVCYHCINKE